MAGRQRGRTGRGWDAAPRPARSRAAGAGTGADAAELDQEQASQADSAERGSSAERGDPAERAREICLRQLATRPRTRAELADTLRRRGVAAEVAAEVLDRYGEVGLIDDEAFARAWVSSRHHGRGLARRALAGELRRKGVDPESVGAALGEIDEDTEAGTARALVDRKLRLERPGQPEATLRRLVGMLARKGYSPGLAVRVVRDAMADHAANAATSSAATDNAATATATDSAELGYDRATGADHGDFADAIEAEMFEADAWGGPSPSIDQ